MPYIRPLHIYSQKSIVGQSAFYNYKESKKLEHCISTYVIYPSQSIENKHDTPSFYYILQLSKGCK